MMNRKYLVAGLIAFTFIVGWNSFLIQRDDKMFKAYYQETAKQNVK
jgi:hypothetical protein